MSRTGELGDPIRVLVVDDHALVTEALSLVLGRATDLEVVAIARNAGEAERLAATHEPDVVVMDYRLPDSDGATVAGRIRAHRSDVQVVMLTGDGSDAALRAAVDAGCTGFVTKSQAIEEIEDAVRAAHAGEASIPPALLARLLPALRPGGSAAQQLTPREREVLQLLADGLSNQRIAEHLVLSVSTVRNHVQSILRKLGAHSRLEAVTIGVREGVARYDS